MTIFELQEDLKIEVNKILQDMIFKNPKGELESIKVYGQNPPKRIQGIAKGSIMPEKESDSLYPSCTIRIDSGRMETAQSAQKVKIIFVIGIYDDDRECQGHKAILNIFHRIMERFSKNPVLNEKYRMNMEAGADWLLDDEDCHPYYHGAMITTWDTAMVRREDPYV